MQAPKNGFFYVLDAKTGAADLGGATSPTISWATHVDMNTGRPVEKPRSALLPDGQAVHVAAEPERRAHAGTRCRSVPHTGLVYIPIHMQDFVFDARRRLQAEQHDVRTSASMGRSWQCRQSRGRRRRRRLAARAAG